MGYMRRDTSFFDMCKELGIERVSLYRYVVPKGILREYGKRARGVARHFAPARKRPF